MSSFSLSNELKSFISAQGYDLRDSGIKKVIRSKPGISVFQTTIFVLLGLLLISLGFVFELLYLLGVLVLLVPLVKYVLRKRYVYEFDLQNGLFEIKDFLSPNSKKIFSFREISGVDVNHYTSNADVSAFSDSNKEYSYEVVLNVGDKLKYELFYFAEKEFNPQDKVLAIKSSIMNWLKPVVAA